MQKLILIRHSNSKLSPDVDSHEWPLSEKGHRRAALFADQLRPYAPFALYSSTEPKAIETGKHLGRDLLLPLSAQLPAFNEQQRRSAPWLDSPADFKAAVSTVFTQPDKIMFGDESANDAYERFSAGVDDLLARHPAGNIAIVTHGTVMAIFLGRRLGRDPLSLWHQIQTMGMPCAFILTLPDLKLLESFPLKTNEA